MMYRQIVKNVEEVMSVLQIISKDNNAKSVPQNNPVDVGIVYSDADEIRKYKALLDDGIITQEEFDAKKKQLLGL